METGDFGELVDGSCLGWLEDIVGLELGGEPSSRVAVLAPTAKLRARSVSQYGCLLASNVALKLLNPSPISHAGFCVC